MKAELLNLVTFSIFKTLIYLSSISYISVGFTNVFEFKFIQVNDDFGFCSIEHTNSALSYSSIVTFFEFVKNLGPSLFGKILSNLVLNF